MGALLQLWHENVLAVRMRMGHEACTGMAGSRIMPPITGKKQVLGKTRNFTAEVKCDVTTAAIGSQIAVSPHMALKRANPTASTYPQGSKFLRRSVRVDAEIVARGCRLFFGPELTTYLWVISRDNPAVARFCGHSVRQRQSRQSAQVVAISAGDNLFRQPQGEQHSTRPLGWPWRRMSGASSVAIPYHHSRTVGSPSGGIAGLRQGGVYRHRAQPR